ncbi:MAG: hypothetical protein AB2598_09320 [Candidatus Thiodiazotropha sp.]
MRLRSIAGWVIMTCAFEVNAFNQTVSPPTGGDVIAKKPFSALLIEYSKQGSKIQTRTRIYFSSKGIRTERLANHNDEPSLVVIKNNNSNKVWLVNPIKRFFAELPRDESDRSQRAITSDRGPLLGVLSNEPCHGMRSQKHSARAVAESELSVWHCRDSDGKEYLQHYSTLLGVVIRQETWSGYVSELQDIQLRDSPNRYFKPSDEMKQISIEELISGRLVLPEFEE